MNTTPRKTTFRCFMNPLFWAATAAAIALVMAPEKAVTSIDETPPVAMKP